MANLNKVMLIGRLTRDPESRTFSNGGKVAKFGFATNNRKKNSATGEWEDDPMFIDVDVFNRGEFGRKADHVMEYLHKGKLVYLEGRLVLERWEDQSGQKRSKHSLLADNFQLLEPRPDGGRQSDGYSSQSEGSSDVGSYETQPQEAASAPDADIPF